ncbi:polymer-forming cytoskeletal protein [Candidatus Saccharibacteria bacterium]|jgi:hypothetical protein|nr:polymer-forming cytoskeletal protein [Candidatus Saccharibacteria bacterium]
MKRSLVNLLIAGSISLLTVIWLGSVPVKAAWSSGVKSSDGSIVVADNETHTGSLYATGKTVKIKGNVEGDLYCAGMSVEIAGSVNGSINCAAQDIKFSGSAKHGVRLAGQEVEVKGHVFSDLSVAGQNVKVQESAHIDGDLNGVAQSLTIDGVVHGGLRFGSGAVVINGEVKQASDVNTGSLSFGDRGRISGPLFYKSDKELKIESSKVAGDITYNSPKEQSQDSGGHILKALLMMVGIFITTGMFVALVLPGFTEKSSQLAKKSFSTTFLVGSAVVFVLPLAGIMLLISSLGSFLALVLLLLWAAVLMLSGVFFAYYLGSLFLQNVQNILLRMLGGLVLVSALLLIPYIQIVAVFAIIVVGTGILVQAVFNGQFKSMRYSLAPEMPKPPMPKSIDKSSLKDDINLETPKPVTKRKTPSKKESSSKKEK